MISSDSSFNKALLLLLPFKFSSLNKSKISLWSLVILLLIIVVYLVEVFISSLFSILVDDTCYTIVGFLLILSFIVNFGF